MPGKARRTTLNPDADRTPFSVAPPSDRVCSEVAKYLPIRSTDDGPICKASPQALRIVAISAAYFCGNVLICSGRDEPENFLEWRVLREMRCDGGIGEAEGNAEGPRTLPAASEENGAGRKARGAQPSRPEKSGVKSCALLLVIPHPRTLAPILTALRC